MIEGENFQVVYDYKKQSRINYNKNTAINSPRTNNSQRQPSTYDNMPSASTNRFPSFNNYNNIFNSNGANFNLNLLQMRNRMQPSSMNFRNPNQWQQYSRPNAPHSQHSSGNAQRFASPVAWGSNTDVTMRTANSRRVNYTDNNIPCNQPENAEFDCNNSNESYENPERLDFFYNGLSMQEDIKVNCHKKCLHLPHIKIPDLQSIFMIDTGSTRSFISPKIADTFFKKFKSYEPFEVVSTHEGSSHNLIINILLPRIFKSNTRYKFYVYNIDERYDGLIGSHLLKQLEANTNMKSQILFTRDAQIPIYYSQSEWCHSRSDVLTANIIIFILYLVQVV